MAQPSGFLSRLLFETVTVLAMSTGCGAFLVGCGTVTKNSSASEARYWDCEYEEEYYIQTEPRGCRVYVQDAYKGESPLRSEIGGLKFRMNQSGSYRTTYQYDPWWHGSGFSQSTDPRRAGSTDWGSLSPSGVSGSYVVKVYKDGYQPAEETVEINAADRVFQQAIGDATVSSEGRLNASFTGKRTLLIALRPQPGLMVGDQEPQQQQQQQQQTVVLGGQSQQGFGTINLTSDPSGCEVFVDGLFVGNTPANLKLTEGVHKLEVKKSGRITYSRSIRILPDSQASLEAVLPTTH